MFFSFIYTEPWLSNAVIHRPNQHEWEKLITWGAHKEKSKKQRLFCFCFSPPLSFSFILSDSLEEFGSWYIRCVSDVRHPPYVSIKFLKERLWLLPGCICRPKARLTVYNSNQMWNFTLEFLKLVLQLQVITSFLQISHDNVPSCAWG